jgi:hypothetical protein
MKLGDTVLYTVREGRSKGEARPAIVVRVYSETVCGVRVLDAGIHDSGSELDRGGMGFAGFLDRVPLGDHTRPGTWWPRE